MDIIKDNDFDNIVNLVCNTNTGQGIINCNPCVLYEHETDNCYSIILENETLKSKFTDVKMLEKEIVKSYLKSIGV